VGDWGLNRQSWRTDAPQRVLNNCRIWCFTAQNTNSGLVLLPLELDIDGMDVKVQPPCIRGLKLARFQLAHYKCTEDVIVRQKIKHKRIAYDLYKCKSLFEFRHKLLEVQDRGILLPSQNRKPPNLKELSGFQMLYAAIICLRQTCP
jgi:hypothetical protein